MQTNHNIINNFDKSPVGQYMIRPYALPYTEYTVESV